MAPQAQTFDRAQVAFCKARFLADSQIDDARDKALTNVDNALDAYLSAPSRTVSAFADKMRALEAEYGRDWQPRHIDSLLADAAVLA